MKRGEIWSLQDRNYASKARPVVIIQSDQHSNFNSIVLCLFTSYEANNIKTRVYIPASVENGLRKDSYVMTDKIVTVDKNMLGAYVGHLSETEMADISEQLRLILSL